jgi:hypothetical protein
VVGWLGAGDGGSLLPDDPEGAGTELGELDGCQALFDNQSVFSLNYGTDSITEAECPIGGSTAAPPRRAKPKTPAGSTGSSKQTAAGTVSAGDSCRSRLTDGTAITLKVTEGEVNCAGAAALLNKWLRRAPNEGTGSGGDLKLYGWECVGAPAAQSPRIGSCRRAGANAVEFNARR